jgi:predicted helicase
MSREADRYQDHLRKAKSNAKPMDFKEFVLDDPKKISWTDNLREAAAAGKKLTLDMGAAVVSSFRPFSKSWLYFNRSLNERVYQLPKLFPTPHHKNAVISVIGVVDRKGFSVLTTDNVPNLHYLDTSQCFPLCWYEKIDADEKPKGDLFNEAEKPDEHGYVRRDGISDWALEVVRNTYKEKNICKEDVFCYVYGILHSPEYRQRFGVDLKKGLPRIPLAGDFWAFSKAGAYFSPSWTGISSDRGRHFR